jgi:hypothetical protein
MSDTSVTLPEWLLASARKHNELVRKAVNAECEYHVKVRLPGHFTQGAAQKYGHKKRTRKYIESKVRRYHTGTDLVKTGTTRSSVPSGARIVMSGSASEGTITGKIKSRLPFGGGTGRTLDEAARRRMNLGAPTRTPTAGVTPADMVAELKRIIPAESREMSARIKAHYLASIRAMKRPRLITGAVLPQV